MTPTVESQVHAGASDAAAHVRKVIHAAHEFEAVLLNAMLGPLEQTFSSLPGKTRDAESDNYHSLGMQALSSTLAAGHGFGIADLIVQSLLKADPKAAAK